MWFYCIEWLCYPTATFTWIKQWKKSAVVEIGAHHFNPDVFTDDILSCWADTRIFLRNIFSYSYFLWKWVSDLVMRFGSCCCWKDMLLRKKKRRKNRQEVRKLRYTLSDRLCANLSFFHFLCSEKFHFRRLQGIDVVRTYIWTLLYSYVVETVA